VRIATLVCAYPPYQGGIGNVAARHAAALRALGHGVEVFCPAGDEAPGTDVVEGIPVHRLAPLLRHGNSALVPQAARRLGGFDAVYLHYPFYGGAELPSLLARARRQPYVAFFHMDVVWDGWRGAVLWAYERSVARAVLGGARRVFVSSLDYAAHSSLARRPPRTLYELPYAVDTEAFAPAPVGDEELRALGVDPGRARVLFVGGMDRDHAFKGVPDLVRAFAGAGLADRAQLVLVGDGGLRPEYERLAAELLPPGTAAFCGRAPDADLLRLYRSSAATVLPSTTREEAFGVVLIESMACGTPVVASALPGVRGVIEEGVQGLLIPPGDVGALSSALAAVVDDPARRAAMAEAARRRAVERFSHARERTVLDETFAGLSA
jgi:glycosyltransferase involved in cell wall biosynthesis